MNIPFYADSEKVASDKASGQGIVLALYFTLVFGSMFALRYFDYAQSKILKLILAILIIGLPCLIMIIGKRNIWRYGDEFLQSLYLKHTAYNGVGILFVLITWQLWGRLTNESMWDNLAISIAPYLLMSMIFSNVRREIRKK